MKNRSESVAGLVGYFGVVFLLTWGAWIGASRLGDGPGRTALTLLGTYAPGIVALLVTRARAGSAGLQELVERLFDWDVPVRWYAFAVGFMLAIKLGVAVVHLAATGSWPVFGATPWYLMLAATLVSTVVGGQAGEELGWRGYALPRLADRLGLGGASVLLGIVWAVWHLPLFVLLDGDTKGQSFPVYLLQVTALSVAIAFLYARTRGSLLLVMLMHAAVNNTKDIVPSAEALPGSPWGLSHSLVAWLTVGLLWVCAAYFLIRMRKIGPQLFTDEEQI